MASPTASRLRKTFKFPSDDSDEDSVPEAMDEEEQETLIKKFRTQNDSCDALYTKVLLSLPLVSILPFLVFSASSTPLLLLSLLSITSLLSTAYTTHVLPPGSTGITLLDSLNKHSAPMSRKEKLLAVEEDGPIRQYLPLLNVLLCVVLLALGRLATVKKSNEAWEILSALPAMVYTVVLLGKWVMGGVDPERELEPYRYQFKGA
ncbi:hypothetical protein BJ875DRAFT_372524 [Amylocarpus encephaloides]|uniref:Uncharacterized protein n=1 Tax=Amylocarpus encephaloides TaxID=45428 RepID=A0A9P8C7C1_9HELO|nr:hypothetical protein BJ875DRAFT_372524 [Amylocarpus encephaloides]